MTCTEEYKEHIEYTFHAFCKVVIRNATINAARTRNRKYKREISLEYLTDEKHYPLGTADKYFQAPEPECRRFMNGHCIMKPAENKEMDSIMEYIEYLEKLLPEKDSLKIVKSEAEKFYKTHSFDECFRMGHELYQSKNFQIQEVGIFLFGYVAHENEEALMLAQDFSISYADREPPQAGTPAGKPGAAI
nr:hypothetical protein [uncultured Anaerostipes sp.]